MAEPSPEEIEEVILDLAKGHPDYTMDQFIYDFRLTIERDPNFAEKRTFQKAVADVKQALLAAGGGGGGGNEYSDYNRNVPGNLQSGRGRPPPPPAPMASSASSTPSYTSSPPSFGTAYSSTPPTKGKKTKTVLEIGDPSGFRKEVGMTQQDDHDEIHPAIAEILQREDCRKKDLMGDMEAIRFLLEVSRKFAGKSTISNDAQKRFVKIIRRIKGGGSKGSKAKDPTEGYPPEYGGDGGVSSKMISEYPLFECVFDYEQMEASDLPLVRGERYYFLEYVAGQRGWGIFCASNNPDMEEYLNTRTVDMMKGDALRGCGSSIPMFGLAPTGYLTPLC